MDIATSQHALVPTYTGNRGRAHAGGLKLRPESQTPKSRHLVERRSAERAGTRSKKESAQHSRQMWLLCFLGLKSPHSTLPETVSGTSKLILLSVKLGHFQAH